MTDMVAQLRAEIEAQVEANKRLAAAAQKAMREASERDEEITRLRDVVEPLVKVVRALDRPGKDAPGHCHRVRGIWDADNGAKAGAACEWCADWEAARTAIASSAN